jgi:hypothetical protein
MEPVYASLCILLRKTHPEEALMKLTHHLFEIEAELQDALLTMMMNMLFWHIKVVQDHFNLGTFWLRCSILLCPRCEVFSRDAPMTLVD